MNHRLATLAVAAVLAVATSVAAAKTVTVKSGVSLEAPKGWTVSKLDDGYAIAPLDGTVTIYVRETGKYCFEYAWAQVAKVTGAPLGAIRDERVGGMEAQLSSATLIENDRPVSLAMTILRTSADRYVSVVVVTRRDAHADKIAAALATIKVEARAGVSVFKWGGASR